MSSVYDTDADIYHLTFDWPSSESIAARLEEIGTSEKDMVDRLVSHHRNIVGVRAFYKHILKEINADQPKSDVFSQGLSFSHLIILINSLMVQSWTVKMTNEWVCSDAARKLLL